MPPENILRKLQLDDEQAQSDAFLAALTVEQRQSFDEQPIPSLQTIDEDIKVLHQLFDTVQTTSLKWLNQIVIDEEETEHNDDLIALRAIIQEFASGVAEDQSGTINEFEFVRHRREILGDNEPTAYDRMLLTRAHNSIVRLQLLWHGIVARATGHGLEV